MTSGGASRALQGSRSCCTRLGNFTPELHFDELYTCTRGLSAPTTCNDAEVKPGVLESDNVRPMARRDTNDRCDLLSRRCDHIIPNDIDIDNSTSFPGESWMQTCEQLAATTPVHTAYDTDDIGVLSAIFRLNLFSRSTNHENLAVSPRCSLALEQPVLEFPVTRRQVKQGNLLSQKPLDSHLPFQENFSVPIGVQRIVNASRSSPNTTHQGENQLLTLTQPGKLLKSWIYESDPRSQGSQVENIQSCCIASSPAQHYDACAKDWYEYAPLVGPRHIQRTYNTDETYLTEHQNQLRLSQMSKSMMLGLSISYTIPMAACLLTPLRVGNGILSLGTGVALVPLRTDERFAKAGVVALEVLWTVFTAGFIALLCILYHPRGTRFLVVMLLLGLHFVVAGAQITDKPLETIINWLAVVLPASAWAIVGLAERRVLITTANTRNTADAQDIEAHGDIELPGTVSM